MFINTSLTRQFLIAGCIYLGQFIIGIAQGWTAPVIPKLQDPKHTVLENLLSEGQASWLGSLSILGGISGPFFAGYISNAIGRKPSLILGGSITLVSYAMLALAKQVAVIMAGRVICGVGGGIVFVTNLVYLGEIASTHIRGTLLTLTGFSSTLGTLFIYVVGPFLSYPLMGWIPVIISGAYIGLVIFVVPETPAYNVLAGKNQEAVEILTLLGRKEDLENVIAAANEKPESNLAQVTEIFTMKANRKAFILIVVLNIAQQMSGITAVLFFATSIFDMTGSNLESYISTIIVGVTQVFAGSLAPLLVERTGRKFLLLVSTAVCSISLAALGMYFYLYENDHPSAEDMPWLALVSLIMFCIGYFCGFGIIPNTFIGEMFSANVRSFGSTLTVTIGWIFGFGVSTAFGYVMPVWGPAVTFWIFCGGSTFAFIFSIIFVPETKGKSLLEIQDMLSR